MKTFPCLTIRYHSRSVRLKIELWGHMYPIQLSSEGEVNKGGNKGIYLALFTDSEGDRCFSIYQTS